MKIEISWFVPYRHEWDVINLLRESSFDTEREEFDRMIYYSTKENLEGIIKDVKESVYQKIYENGIVEYYKKGNLIPIVVDKKKENWKELVENERNSKSVRIGIDLGMYDFIKYLDSVKKEEKADSPVISKNRKSKDPSFDELFVNDNAMNRAILGMKNLEMINDSFKYLMGGKRSFIFSFIEVCREFGLIHADTNDNVVTRVITIKLGLGVKRFGSSKKVEISRIKKIL